MSTAAIVTTILQLVGILLIAAGVVVTSRRETEAQDTAIVISLGQDYRRRWETTGREVVDRLEQQRDKPSSEDQMSLLSMLNLSPARSMGPLWGEFRQQHGTTAPPVMGPPGHPPAAMPLPV